MGNKILLIDDDADLRNLTKIRLQAFGFDVALACDGEEGLVVADREKPELIIVDVMMPKMDGYTFVREIKTINHLKDIPIIVLTSKTGMKDLFEIEGVLEYMTKPYEVDELYQKIHKCLKKSS